MKFSREATQQVLADCGLCVPFGLAMFYTLPAFAMRAEEFDISRQSMTSLRVACLIAVLLGANLLRFMRRPRTPRVVRTMTLNWAGSTVVLVGVGLLSGAMPLNVGGVFLLTSFMPLARLEVDDRVYTSLDSIHTIERLTGDR